MEEGVRKIRRDVRAHPCPGRIEPVPVREEETRGRILEKGRDAV